MFSVSIGLKSANEYIYNTQYIWIKKTHKISSNYKYFSSFQKLCQCIIKLQMKIQITQQHNKSKLKNTYRIKKIIVKGKI